MIARAVNAAADVIHRAQVNGAVTAAGLAMALESAQLLVSPEMVHESAEVEAERDRLKARVAELEQELLALSAQGTVLRRRAALEDPHDSPLHRSYRTPHDLPETGGVL